MSALSQQIAQRFLLTRPAEAARVLDAMTHEGSVVGLPLGGVAAGSVVHLYPFGLRGG